MAEAMNTSELIAMLREQMASQQAQHRQQMKAVLTVEHKPEETAISVRVRQLNAFELDLKFKDEDVQIFGIHRPVPLALQEDLEAAYDT
ncbi:hypothetical protein ElyMa_005428100 [Elysia marginata]|uniref:Uncharacterized protein n=1 Tax=Elysia marginata TaxID=1093978 RepID=A0AAV4EK85_9GAST|nr:hypothetical protein ElyMa_005428100 [Elysia marginata]